MYTVFILQSLQNLRSYPKFRSMIPLGEVSIGA